jgi:adenine-specific DNA-methyltransferase
LVIFYDFLDVFGVLGRRGVQCGLSYDENEIARLRTIQGKSSHSAWLTFMYPRLKIAQKLLTDDGVIFVSIDDNEQANLKLLMDDVFGEGNFRNCIAIRRGAKSVQAQFENIDKLGIAYEYILMYSKNADVRFNHFYFDLDEKREGTWNNHWRGTDRPTMRYELVGIIPEKGQWRWAKERSLKAIENYKNMLVALSTNNPTQEKIDNWYEKQSKEFDLLRISNNNKPEHYVAPTNQKFGNNLWTDLQINGTSELGNLGISLFDNPKNPALIRRMLKWQTKDNDIILDFFAGSATTAHAVMQLNSEDGGNRKFIMVQLDEPTNPESEARKAGYSTIDEIARERIKRAAKKIKTEAGAFASGLDCGFQHYQLKTPDVQTIDKITEFDPKKSELFGNMISPFAFSNESGVPSILQTWLLADGNRFDTKIENIALGNYTAPYIKETGTIYLIEPNFDTEALKALLNKIGKNELSVSTICIYPYSFTFTELLELKNNVKNNLDNSPTIIERY